MSKAKIKTNNVSGFRIAVMIISVLLLSFIMAFSMLLGISSLKRNAPVTLNPDATTVRKKLPADGAVNPVNSTPIDNIGYMAYVLDNQPFYHVYAHNSTKSTGYEQVTQSWKDYKNADLSGVGLSVMVCSDLSYSALVKSSSQSCFIGDNEAHIRGGNKPGKNSQPLDIEWSTGKPAVYDKEKYKYDYGEFSTEISVYVINEDTLASAGEVVDNGDGTYSQNYILNETAGCWYQYGMKTRGGLKTFPVFKKIEITFTFDSKWQVLESYCEEKATINPRALGGMDMASASVTKTTFDYSEEGFDHKHYAYFDDFFKTYMGSTPGDKEPEVPVYGVLDILGSGFSKVLSEDGQQFGLSLNLGNTAYNGKVYLKLSDLGDVLNTLEARIALERKDSGRQDLYIEFKNAAVNVYYSTDFAMTASIDEMSQSVNKITKWIKSLNSEPAVAASYALTSGGESRELDIGSLLTALKLDITDTEATVSLKSDNLLGLGIGVDVAFGFDRIKEEDGDTFSVKSFNVNDIKYNGEKISLTADIVPDDGTVISRAPAQTPANLAEYVDSVYNILSSKTVKIDIDLADKLVDGLTLDASAYLSIGSNIAANVQLSAAYKGISVKLDASYIYEKVSYGKLYLHVTEVNGKAVDAKVYCDIGDTVKTVKDIIAIFKPEDDDGGNDDSDGLKLAEIVNKVLNLDFSAIIGKVSGNADSISLEINIDALLSGLDVSIGLEFGSLSLTFDRANEIISGSVPTLGLDLAVSGSDTELPVIGDKDTYVDINVYLESVKELLSKPSYDIAVTFAGTKLTDKIDLTSLGVSAVATAAVENGNIRLKLPATVSYGDYSLELCAYYTVNLADKSYGKVYLNVTKLKTADKEIALDAKIYCDIKDTVDSVQKIIAKFTPEEDGGVAAASEQASILSKAIETLLKLDYNEIITATNEKLTVNLDVDEVLSGLDISLGGITFGNLNLEFVTETSTLSGSLETLGLSLSVSGNDAALEEFVLSNYVDLGVYLDSVNMLLSKPSYDITVTFNGTKLTEKVDLSGLKVKGTVTAAVENNAIRVKLPATVNYDDYGVELCAYYTINLADKSYGKVYLNVTKLKTADKEIALDAKIYCDIKDAVDGIKALIESFTPKEDGGVAAASEHASMLSKAIETLLKLDYNEIIKATNEKLTVKLDVDEILSGLEISLGGISFGDLNLEFVTETSTLSGSLETLGLSLSVSGNDNALEAFVLSNYVDLGVYLDSVNALLSKPSYNIAVTFNGTKLTEKIDLSGLSVIGAATVAVAGKNIRVKLPVTAQYEDYSIELCVYYTINLADKNYGKVYLNVTKLKTADKEIALDAKIYCDIKDTVDSVQKIITKFTPKKNGADAGVAVASEQASVLSKAIATLLKLDYNEIIKATNEKLTVNLDVDEVLSGLDISIGGISFGNLNLEFVTKTSTLSGSLETLGLSLNVSGSDAALEEFTTSNYVNIKQYLDNVVALTDKNSYNFELSFVGNNYIHEKVDLTGLKVDVSAQIAFTKDYAGVNVNISKLSVTYKEVSLLLSAHYEVTFDGSYGTIYLNIAEVNGVEVSNAKVKLNITDAVNGVNNIINAFKAPEIQTYAEGETAASSSIVSKIINGVLKLNFKELLTVTDEKAKVKLDLDKLLSEFNLGLNLGTVDLEYTPKDFTLSGSDIAIGLNLIKLTGCDKLLGDFPVDGYIDLNAFIAGVEGIVNSEIYEIVLSYTGGALTEKIDLTGLTLNATAYAAVENGYNNITVSVPMTVGYHGLEVELCAYYSADISAGNYSTVYIELKRIDKTALNVKVYCDIQDAIGTVKEIINSFNSGVSGQSEENSGTADIISKVIGIVLNLDYPNIIEGSATHLSVTVDVDEILTALNVNLGGITVGDLQLGLTLDKEKGANLCGKLESFGAEITLKGNDSYIMPAAPVKDDYLDLSAVLKLVRDMINEGKAIAEAKDVVFSINGSGEVDGTPVSVSGNGEVVWAANSVKVAVSLSIAVDKYDLDLSVIYDGTVKDNEPFVIIVLNGEGVKVTRGEINKLVKSVKDLLAAFGVNSDKSEPAPAASGYALSVGGYTLEEILKNDNVKKVLNAILGFANEFAVEVESTDAAQAIYNLILKHTDGYKVTLGADGCLSLAFAKDKELLATASVKAGDGTTVTAIRNQLESSNYKYYELSAFVRLLYKNLFDRIEEISLKELLGDGAYSVKLDLVGVDSGISVLEGIKVNAELYYDEGVVGTKRTTKLMRVDLDLDINGTAVIASAAYNGNMLYIGLDRIGGTALTGIKFKANVMNVFDAAEQLVKFITDTNLAEMLSKITGKGNIKASESEAIAAFAAVEDENGETAPTALSKLLGALLSLNIEESFKFDGKNNTATINVDSISEALLGVKIGTITAKLDSAEKTLSASVKQGDGKAWLTFNAGPCEFKADIVDPDAYMDISFVSTLLSDLVNTVTSDSKKVYDLYTFTGSIAVDVKDIPVLGNINIRFNNATLTAGFDNSNKFYVTLAASMQKTTAIGFTVTAARDISITYCDGLVVLGREIGTSNEKYKVLTLEYLLDHLLDKNNSPVRWLLGTSDFVWGILADNINLNLDSGLTKPKTYALYEQLQQTVKEGKFDLADYLSGMTVKAGNSEPLSVYGGGATLATDVFGLSGDNNHYALDLNAKQLTGGILSELCAVITRNDKGLSGIKAYGAIKSSVGVSFMVDFGTYLEGETDIYDGMKLELDTTVTADNFYNDYAEAEDVNATNFTEKTYYKYDGDNGEMVQATAFEEGVKYFVKANTVYYLENGTLATAFEANTSYYKYVVDSTEKLGEVAVRNYLDYVTKTYGFDKAHKFTNDKQHIDPIFGCFNSEDKTYEASDVLETIYFDVYKNKGDEKPEKTLEVLYGSTVKLIREFPEFADEGKTQKLVYVIYNSDDAKVTLPNEVVVTDDTTVANRVAIVYVDGKGRVSIYKDTETAVEVVFNFGNLIKPVSAAMLVGDELAAYELNDYTFLGWFKEDSFTTRVASVNESDLVDGKLTVYGKYIKSFVEGKNGVNYSYDAELDAYFVSGVNNNIKAYYTNGKHAGEWLEIADNINGYPVKYIGREAFANADNKVETSLVKVFVPETVVAVYDKAFLNNKGLKQVVFCADAVFFGGRADSDTQSSVFYGCYPNAAANNNDLTVYYNGIQNRPEDQNHVSTFKSEVDANGWHRIYFEGKSINNGWKQKAYVLNTLNSDWAFVEYITNVFDTENKPSALPSDVDFSKLSELTYKGVYTKTYADKTELANTISNTIMSCLKETRYSVTASNTYQLDGKRYTVTLTVNEHVVIKPATELNVVIVLDKVTSFEDVTTFKVSDLAPYVNFVDLYKDDTKLSYTDKGNYVFFGWFKDSALTQPAPLTNDGTVTKLYAKVVVKTYAADNGVNYSFDTTLKAYYVSGVNDKISSYYNNADKWLEIADEINGYPVKYIGANAFANSDNDVAHSLVNVFVPASVVAVYDNAFLNNKGLKQVVFCADAVFFGGRADSSTKTSVFYGCYPGSADNNYDLTVYYTDIQNGPDDQAHISTYNSTVDAGGWFRIYFEAASVSNGWKQKTYVLNVKQGGWVYTKFVLDNETDLTCDFDIGFSSTYKAPLELPLELDDAFISDLQSSVLSNINAHTANCEKCGYAVNKYSVTAVKSGERLRTITVTISENANALYRVAFSDDVSIEGLTKYGNNYFATPGSSYKISPKDGYIINSISGVTASEDGSGDKWSFVMPASAVTIQATCQVKPITVSLNSSIAFTSDSLGSDKFNADGTVATIEAVGGTALPVPKATGYTFLGWAYENQSNIEFSTTVNNSTFYAVWYKTRSELSEVSVSDGVLKAKSTGTLYGWYSNADFTGSYVACAAEDGFYTATPSISKTNSVFYARMKYSLNVQLNAGSTNWYYTETAGDGYDDMKDASSPSGQSIGSGNTVFSKDFLENHFAELENFSVKVYRYWTDALVIKVIGNNNSCLKTYLIKGQYSYTEWFQTKYDWRGIFNSYTKDDKHYVVFGDGNWTVSNSLDKNETDEAGKTRYYSSSNDLSLANNGTNDYRYFGTASSVNGNISFLVNA